MIRSGSFHCPTAQSGETKTLTCHSRSRRRNRLPTAVVFKEEATAKMSKLLLSRPDDACAAENEFADQGASCIGHSPSPVFHLA